MIKNSLSDCKLYLRRSLDDLETLSEKICVTPSEGYFVVNNDRVIVLRDGRIMYAAAFHYCENGTPETWSPRGVACIYFSDDNGYTWNESPTRLEGPLVAGTGLQEPGLVELGDGRLYLWARTDLGAQYESFSSDRGLTWSKAKASKIKSPLSAASIKNIPNSNKLLLVWNDHSGQHAYIRGRRVPLCFATSTDDGKTWSESSALEPLISGWYCYISITFINDKIILSYCAGDSIVGLLNRLKVIEISNL